MPNFCGYPDGPCRLARGVHKSHPGTDDDYDASGRKLHMGLPIRKPKSRRAAAGAVANALLTLGSTVDVEYYGQTRRFVVHSFKPATNKVVIDTPCGVPPVSLSQCELFTIEPPTIDFIRNLARERCCAEVAEMDEGPDEEPYIRISTAAWTINIWDSDGIDRYRAAVAAVTALSMALGSREDLF